MQTLPAVVNLLERVYAPLPNEKDWLSEVIEAARSAFGGHLAIQAFTGSLSSSLDMNFQSMVGDDSINENMLRMIEYARSNDPSLLQYLYSAGPFISIRTQLVPARGDRLVDMLNKRVGSRDVVIAFGLDASGSACGVGWLRSSVEHLPRQVHQSIERIAAHLASAYRLRRRADQDIATTDSQDTLVDLRDDTLTRKSARLREAVLSVDRARRIAGGSPDQALACWKALVDGKWTLLERFMDGDRRVFVARPNEPTKFELHALSAREKTIVTFAVLGHSSKLIAYELDINESTVSRHMASALQKLNLTSRSELIELYGALVGAPTDGQ